MSSAPLLFQAAWYFSIQAWTRSSADARPFAEAGWVIPRLYPRRSAGATASPVGGCYPHADHPGAGSKAGEPEFSEHTHAGGLQGGPAGPRRRRKVPRAEELAGQQAGSKAHEEPHHGDDER